MKLANQIQSALIRWAGSARNDVIIPNFYIGMYECDLFLLRSSGISIEYEIKISKPDFKADFKKGSKHRQMKDGQRCNRFFFVVPEGLISANEVPDYAGLIFYKNDWFTNEKGSKMLHNRRYSDYKSLCNSLAGRCLFQGQKIRELKNDRPKI